MNFIQASLVAAQIFVFGASQYVGRFFASVGATKVYMDVYESESVVFMLEGNGLPMYVSGRFPLKGDGSSYTLDVENGAELQELYGNITKFRISVQDKDLTTFSYFGVNEVSTSLQGEKVELERVAFGLMTGTFLYTEGDDDSLMLRFKIDSDGELKAAVLCNKKPFLITLQLSRQETESGFVYYEIQSTRRGSLDDLHKWVRENCPLATHGLHDLSTVMFASPSTIYSQLGGLPVALRKKRLL
ncbi:hypothetical protein FOZ60_016545 [Perkinsus olseni]|uniref:Uncharacterized protein n=2 Tax=Perkinsus olseni TaxID=32597 RepID=A0A7J6P4E0_PEROL|nr:hypothetical protein FOZ60_016545 [Perkinsus olseni]